MILDAIWGLVFRSVQIFDTFSYFGSGKWVFLGKFPKIGKICVSHERLTVETCLTPQNDRKTHFSISVSYIVYLSDDRKCPKMQKQFKKARKCHFLHRKFQIYRKSWQVCHPDVPNLIYIGI